MARARWLGSIVLVAGCGSWPRWSALEEPGVPVTSAGDAEWPASSAESEPNDTLDAVAAIPLAPGAPVLLTGEFTGTGWCAEDEHPDACAPATDPGCGTPLGWAGRYAGDVDLVVVDVTGDGPLTLCARGVVPGGETLFDALLYPFAADCPDAPVLDGEEPLGWSLGPAADGWSAPVTEGRYLLLLGGPLRLDGGDPEAAAGWTLGLAVLPGDGGLTACPALPDEAEATP